jgi:hypothetical protein
MTVRIEVIALPYACPLAPEAETAEMKWNL